MFSRKHLVITLLLLATPQLASASADNIRKLVNPSLGALAEVALACNPKPMLKTGSPLSCGVGGGLPFQRMLADRQGLPFTNGVLAALESGSGVDQQLRAREVYGDCPYYYDPWVATQRSRAEAAGGLVALRFDKAVQEVKDRYQAGTAGVEMLNATETLTYDLLALSEGRSASLPPGVVALLGADAQAQGTLTSTPAKSSELATLEDSISLHQGLHAAAERGKNYIEAFLKLSRGEGGELARNKLEADGLSQAGTSSPLTGPHGYENIKGVIVDPAAHTFANMVYSIIVNAIEIKRASPQ